MALKQNDTSDEKDVAKSVKKNTSLKKYRDTIIFGSVVTVLLIIIICLAIGTIETGSKALAREYDNAYKTEANTVYEMWYQKYYDKAKDRYLVSNKTGITIGNIKEIGKLEVLRVSDVEYVIVDRNDNKSNIISWLEVPGQGIFVIDLEAAEFVVNNERNHVLVRVPYPELTNVSIDYENVKSVLFKNDIFDDSYKDGEDLAKLQLTEGDLLIKKEFKSNQNFFLNAQKAARNSIICLVNQLNPDVEDLQVEVEFY